MIQIRVSHDVGWHAKNYAEPNMVVCMYADSK